MQAVATLTLARDCRRKQQVQYYCMGRQQAGQDNRVSVGRWRDVMVRMEGAESVSYTLISR